MFTIERQKKLFERTREFLPKIGYYPKVFYGDGYKGLLPHAPFDKILITAAAPEIPDDLIMQLKPGGVLVCPVGPQEMQTMVLISKVNETETERKEFDQFRFVPMLENKAKD